MKRLGRGFFPLLAALCLLLSGCADQTSEARITTGDGSPETDVPSSEKIQPAEEAAAPEDSGSPEDLTESPAGLAGAAGPAAPEPENLFEILPRSYLFCSGAGGWSTELSLEADGTFTGMYHDSDMGDLDEVRYPNGTVYLCQFRGRFAQPEPVDEIAWTMRIESLELDHPDDGAEEIEDGVRYIYSGPYGLEDTEELTVYLPATPAEGLSENVLWAARGPYDWSPTEAGTLGLTILYNAAQDHGFVQYPYGGA